MQINTIPNLVLKIDCINCPISKILAEIRKASSIDIAMGKNIPIAGEPNSDFDVSLRIKELKFSDFLSYIAAITDRYWSIIDQKFTLCVLPSIDYYEKETQEHLSKSFEILEKLNNEYPDLQKKMSNTSSSKSEIPFSEFPETLQPLLLDFFEHTKKSHPDLSDDIIKHSKINFIARTGDYDGSYNFSIFPRNGSSGMTFSEQNPLISRKTVLREVNDIKKSGGLIISPKWNELFTKEKITQNTRNHSSLFDRMIPRIKTTTEHNKFILDVIKDNEFILIHRFFRAPDDIEHGGLKLDTLLNDWCQKTDRKWAIDQNGVLLVSRLRDLRLTPDEKTRPLQIRVKPNPYLQRRPAPSKLEITLVKS